VTFDGGALRPGLPEWQSVGEGDMAGTWNLDRVADAFTAAATEPSRWSLALDVVSRETGSLGALMFPIKGRTPFLPMSESMQASAEFYFQHGWHARDLRRGAISRIVREGIGVDFDYTTEDSIRTDPFYQEFLARFGLKYFAGVKISASDDLWVLSIQRGHAEGPFNADEQRRLAGLGDRLSAATTLARALGFAHLAGMADGLEHAGLAAILLDRHGAVVRLNAAAQRLMGSRLMVARGRLVSADPSLNRGIDRMIGEALGFCGAVSLPLPIALPKPPGRALVLHALPLTGDAGLLFAPARALVLVRDLDHPGVPLDAHLSSLFGLTKAETRMAIEIAAGHGVRASAERLGVTVNTAHTQLAAVFAKTGTRRQAELVRVLSRLATLA
jgi:DNA-binding CsgD family transcriptional regulator